MSYPLSPDIPVFPGLSPDEFFLHSLMSKGGDSNASMIKHFLHNGTHVDAPRHFDDRGKTIDRIPIEDFVYSRPLLVRKKLGKSGLVMPEDLKAFGDGLFSADILLLCTGYHEIRRNREAYVDDFPALSVEAARMIRTELLNVRAVAIDTLSIESCVGGPRHHFQVHKTLLDGGLYSTRPLLIFEDVNMAPILGRQITRIYSFPVRLVGLEASPASIVAEVT
jgi:kynurenine formamidase